VQAEGPPGSERKKDMGESPRYLLVPKGVMVSRPVCAELFRSPVNKRMNDRMHTG